MEFFGSETFGLYDIFFIENVMVNTILKIKSLHIHGYKIISFTMQFLVSEKILQSFLTVQGIKKPVSVLYSEVYSL